jgi:hypothetical protein
VGGLFAPSLFIGALVGDIMGHFVANRCAWVFMWCGCSNTRRQVLGRGLPAVGVGFSGSTPSHTRAAPAHTRVCLPAAPRAAAAGGAWLTPRRSWWLAPLLCWALPAARRSPPLA